MAKLISGIILLIVGVILAIIGNSMNNDLATKLTSVLSGGSSNPGTPLIVIGIILIVIGIVLLVMHFISKKKEK